MTKDNETDKLNKEMAREHWKHRREQVDKSLDFTIQFGHAAIKSPGVVNMAAFAAFLGFVSANADKLVSKGELVETCFIWFCVGVVASALATGSAYFTQYSYSFADNSYKTFWEHPYIEDIPCRMKWVSIALHALTVVFVLTSYLSLIWGAWNFLDLTKSIIVGG